MKMDFESSRGESNRMARLTLEQVRAIRREYDQGHRGKERAAFYETSPANFNRIGRRETWSCLR